MFSDDSNDELIPNTEKTSAISRKEHDKVLEETKTVCQAFMWSSSIGYLSESMMLTTWILFAKTLPDCSDEGITILVFLQSTLQVIGVLLTSYLSDKYGFDMITILTSTILLISAVFHSLSFSIITLGIGISFKGLAMDDIEVLALAFISKLLPYNIAAIYTGYWYAVTTITYMIGLVSGGLLASFLSYRMVFIVSLFIIILRWIYIVIKIRNTQKKLTQKQLKFIEYYLQDEDAAHLSNNNIEMSDFEKTLFPLCVEKIRDQNKNTQIQGHINDVIAVTSKIWLRFELLLNMIQFGLVSTLVVVTFQFNAAYMLERYQLSIFASTSQIGLGGITFAILSAITPDYIQAYSLTEKYLFAVPFYCILIAIFMFVIPLTNKQFIYLLWLWWLIIGFVLAVLFVISEICIIELMPKRHTGKINGIKTAIRFGIAAVLAALIAYYWNYGSQHIWFCYWNSIAYSIAFCIDICLIFRAVLRAKI